MVVEGGSRAVEGGSREASVGVSTFLSNNKLTGISCQNKSLLNPSRKI